MQQRLYPRTGNPTSKKVVKSFQTRTLKNKMAVWVPKVLAHSSRELRFHEYFEKTLKTLLLFLKIQPRYKLQGNMALLMMKRKNY